MSFRAPAPTSDAVPTGTADTRSMNKVLSVIPIGVAAFTAVFVVVDLLTGALG
ncbi:hypothetical protein [Ornithinimicrobium sp. W1665]|uniref:hypothetical protein n=1 Tax=Ornithinimicrobium sp. W1665 TaxID=3416666 RepID=UPI003CEB5BC7